MLTAAVQTYKKDLPDDKVEEALSAGLIAWDIETTGLDWERERIATCQILIPSFDIYVIQFNGDSTCPANLRTLLSDESVLKIFHHAMFDLRFMAYQWNAAGRNIACTKIASKLLEPSQSDHSLQYLLAQYLGINLSKSSRVSNWLSTELSKEQLEYAAGDVHYLPELYKLFRERLEAAGRWELASATFDFLPNRVQLDLLGAGDVFSY
jgi:ribonuclease D